MRIRPLIALFLVTVFLPDPDAFLAMGPAGSQGLHPWQHDPLFTEQAIVSELTFADTELLVGTPDPGRARYRAGLQIAPFPYGQGDLRDDLLIADYNNGYTFDDIALRRGLLARTVESYFTDIRKRQPMPLVDEETHWRIHLERRQREMAAETSADKIQTLWNVVHSHQLQPYLRTVFLAHLERTTIAAAHHLGMSVARAGGFRARIRAYLEKSAELLSVFGGPVDFEQAVILYRVALDPGTLSERHVLEAFAGGWNDEEIGRLLAMPTQEVRALRKSAFKKSGFTGHWGTSLERTYRIRWSLHRLDAVQTPPRKLVLAIDAFEKVLPPLPWLMFQLAKYGVSQNDMASLWGKPRLAILQSLSQIDQRLIESVDAKPLRELAAKQGYALNNWATAAALAAHPRAQVGRLKKNVVPRNYFRKIQVDIRSDTEARAALPLIEGLTTLQVGLPIEISGEQETAVPEAHDYILHLSFTETTLRVRIVSQDALALPLEVFATPTHPLLAFLGIASVMDYLQAMTELKSLELNRGSKDPRRFDLFTTENQHILGRIGMGWNNRDIGEELGLTPSQVNYRAVAMGKALADLSKVRPDDLNEYRYRLIIHAMRVGKLLPMFEQPIEELLRNLTDIHRDFTDIEHIVFDRYRLERTAAEVSVELANVLKISLQAAKKRQYQILIRLNKRFDKISGRVRGNFHLTLETVSALIEVFISQPHGNPTAELGAA